MTDYNFIDKKPEKKPQPEKKPAIAKEHQALIDEGIRLKVRSLTTGKLNPILQAAAEAHAQYQAARGVQGHQKWDQRVAVLFKQMPDSHEFREVANESWPDQDLGDAAKEMYNSWRQSPGHWGAVNGKCDSYGYAMVYRPQNKTWYACGIFADLREKKV